jgi:hypothetical protein
VISPDDLAARLSPPRGTGPAYAAQLYLSDGAMDLAERIIDATAPGPHQDVALDGLVRVLHSAYAGVDPDRALPAAGAPAPSRARDEAAGHPDVDLDQALVLDVGVWRLGLRTSRALHPLSRLTGFVLSEACGPSGYIATAHQPTLTDLSEQTGLALHQLHTHLHDLTSRGWISRHLGHGGRRSLFQLRLPTPTR